MHLRLHPLPVDDAKLQFPVNSAAEFAACRQR